MSNGAPQYPHSGLSDLEIRARENEVEIKATGESERIIATGLVLAGSLFLGWKLAQWLSRRG